jgi:hypothetical protein
MRDCIQYQHGSLLGIIFDPPLFWLDSNFNLNSNITLYQDDALKMCLVFYFSSL